MALVRRTLERDLYRLSVIRGKLNCRQISIYWALQVAVWQLDGRMCGLCRILNDRER
jgi:hypothetical protein